MAQQRTEQDCPWPFENSAARLPWRTLRRVGVRTFEPRRSSWLWLLLPKSDIPTWKNHKKKSIWKSVVGLPSVVLPFCWIWVVYFLCSFWDDPANKKSEKPPIPNLSGVHHHFNPHEFTGTLKKNIILIREIHRNPPFQSFNPHRCWRYRQWDDQIGKSSNSSGPFPWPWLCLLDGTFPNTVAINIYELLFHIPRYR